MLLKELSPGTKGTIVGYDKKAPEYRRRLLMLGATPGTAFEDIPDDWVCPICGLGKEVFVAED